MKLKINESEIKIKHKSTDKSNIRKNMWYSLKNSLKKHIGLLTNIVADSSVVLQLSKLSLISCNQLSTNSSITLEKEKLLR